MIHDMRLCPRVFKLDGKNKGASELVRTGSLALPSSSRLVIVARKPGPACQSDDHGSALPVGLILSLSGGDYRIALSDLAPTQATAREPPARV